MEIDMIEKTKDRFDLEQEILQCWNITDDIKSYVAESATSEEFAALAQYYERKFDRLWNGDRPYVLLRIANGFRL